MHKKHFFLSNNIAEARDFSPRNLRPGNHSLPTRDRAEHGQMVKGQYETAVNQAISRLEERENQGQPVANGIYVDLKMDKSFIPNSLGKQDSPTGATIMKVTDNGDENDVDVTVYVKKDKKDWLKNKVDDYSCKNTAKGKPCNERLIAPINGVVATDIRTLYVSAEEFETIPKEGSYIYELWMSHSKENSQERIENTLHQLDIEKMAEPLLFDGVDVWLIKSTKQQLCTLPLSLGYIEGIRPYHKPSILTSSNPEKREWSELIKGEITYDEDADVIVGILDSGVNNAHELLKPALPDERMDVAIGVLEATDKTDHGTGMAGLALLGDLANIAYQRETPVAVHHALSSVKIYEDGYDTPKEFYGAVIEEAIGKASDMGASIQCMAITDESAYNGIATSSSAALDESIYHQGQCDRLVLVSAGNIQTPDVDHNNYIESCKANPDEHAAIYSNEKCATYIFENQLEPYTQGDSGNIYGKMHYYNLPWPKEQLEDMGDEYVRIRITLSYYVKPSPGYAGRTNKYRYPSATLHFDLKTATETEEEFLCRRNKQEGEKTTQNDATRWNVKQQKRERGTVQSDWIECTAADLAEMDKIVVFPGSGWWKERKLDNVDNSVPYSLIVSIETKETDIYNAVETAISNRIGVPIAQEV